MRGSLWRPVRKVGREVIVEREEGVHSKVKTHAIVMRKVDWDWG